MDSTDSQNPNLVGPPIGGDDGVKSKHTTRSHRGVMKNNKLHVSQGMYVRYSMGVIISYTSQISVVIKKHLK